MFQPGEASYEERTYEQRDYDSEDRGPPPQYLPVPPLNEFAIDSPLALGTPVDRLQHGYPLLEYMLSMFPPINLPTDETKGMTVATLVILGKDHVTIRVNWKPTQIFKLNRTLERLATVFTNVVAESLMVLTCRKTPLMPGESSPSPIFQKLTLLKDCLTLWQPGF